MTRIKGHEIAPINITNSFDRRAHQYKNKIVTNLKKIGIRDDDIEVPLERFGIKNVPGTATFWFNDHRLYYSYSRSKTFVNNLYIVQKLIELEVEEVLNGEKSEQEFCNTFTEDKDVENQRKEARELIGVSEDCVDMEEISKKYKVLAKDSHPDMPNGNHEIFQKLNRAHKLLKRELE
ncbi:J domain-containing protein [archaeon]|jgi:hypothetical protein|nr:J domain-containing protein [archaeon]